MPPPSKEETLAILDELARWKENREACSRRRTRGPRLTNGTLDRTISLIQRYHDHCAADEEWTDGRMATGADLSALANRPRICCRQRVDVMDETPCSECGQVFHLSTCERGQEEYRRLDDSRRKKED